MRGFTVLFGPDIPEVLGGRTVIGFRGPGCPEARVNWTAMSRQQRNRKLRNRRRRKLGKLAQRRSA